MKEILAQTAFVFGVVCIALDASLIIAVMTICN